MKAHLRAKHHEEFSKYTKILDETKLKNEKRLRENDCDTIPNSATNKKQKTELFQQIIPGYVDSIKHWDINTSKAQELHRDVFEFLVENMHPWSTVQDRGFLRIYQKQFPNFRLAHPTYYASFLDPTYDNIKNRLKESIKNDNPASVVISLDA